MDPKALSDRLIRRLSPEMVRTQVESLASDIHANNYALGGLILRVREEGLWKKWGKRTFLGFGDWCWAILGFRDRKAEELVKIYLNLQGLKVSGKVKRDLVNLGWTKLRFLTRVLDDDNAEEWLGKATSLASRALEAEVRIATGDETKVDEAGDETKDQEAKRKRIRLGLEFDDPDDYRFVVDAIATIERRTGESANGRIISMMASAYLAMHVRDDEGGMAIEVERMLQAIERDYGIKLKVVGSTVPPKKKGGRKKGVKK